ncbi:MAG: hypothetical protein IJQ89_08410 [Bacteroidales bacterium]|nr:hypothetical protein [Bacteroidales bacterium]
MKFLNDLAGDNKIAFYLGLISLIVFLIMFFVSKKKRVPIFVGIADLVLQFVAIFFFAAFMIVLNRGEFNLKWLIFLVPLAISIFLTLRKPFPVWVKVFSVVAKLFFVLAGASVILLFIVLVISSFRKKEMGKSGLWEELKDIAKMGNDIGDSEP